MELESSVRDFLSSRRARITPDQAGLPSYGGTRRVPGLRREEVAMLAGMSVDYYIKLERGNLRGVSEQVLDSLANALQLDDAERVHLFDLARAASQPTARRATASSSKKPAIRPVIQQILDALGSAPACIRNARHDLLASNALGRALYEPIYREGSPGSEIVVDGRVRRFANTARFIYLDPVARTFFADWNQVADDSAAMLRSEAGRNPHDADLTQLIGELSTQSGDFRRRWASSNVRFHRSGTKRMVHPIIGEVELGYEAMSPASNPELTLLVYVAPEGSPESDALRVLGSWTTEAALAR
jgi:transcriptional regulator with XRE-family HTH domain